MIRWSAGERVQERTGQGSKDKNGGGQGQGRRRWRTRETDLGRLLPRVSELGTRANGPRRNVLLPGSSMVVASPLWPKSIRTAFFLLLFF